MNDTNTRQEQKALNQALIDALMEGLISDPEEVRRLLEAGADPNFRDRRGLRPLAVAVECGDIEACSLLLEAGAEPNATDDGAAGLHRVALLADVVESPDVCRLLLEHGAAPDLRDGDGRTALQPRNIHRLRQ